MHSSAEWFGGQIHGFLHFLSVGLKKRIAALGTAHTRYIFLEHPITWSLVLKSLTFRSEAALFGQRSS